MKRTALGECRWAGATSPGSKYWTATEMVWVLVRSGTPGLSSRTIRRSAPRPGFMNSGVRRTSGSMSRQRHILACTADFLGAIRGPGRVHGASSPAAARLAQYSSRAVSTEVVWMLMISLSLSSRSPCQLASSGDERLVHSIGTDPPRGDGPPQGEEPTLLGLVGHRHRGQDSDRALAVVLLDLHVLVVEVE